jgi:short-subunit dehydrogenase
MQTNYFGPVWCAWRALPHLKASRGAIAVVSSLQGKTGFPGFAAYCASKHALHGFFDSLRSELHTSGVQVTIACPGAVATEIREDQFNQQPGMMTSDECARLILRAVKAGRRELLMTAAGAVGAYLRPFFPGLLDAYVRRRLAQFHRN